MDALARRRALVALLASALVTNGCTSVRLKEHRHPGPAVSVKVVWDGGDASRLVGGVQVRLEPAGGAPLEGVTLADAPLLFDWLKPGRHRIVLSADGVTPIERTFDLPPERRVSVKVLVDAFERTPDDDADDDGEPTGLFVLKVVGAVLIVGLVVLLVAVIDGALDDDDDDDPCGPCSSHRRNDDNCRCTCHL